MNDFDANLIREFRSRPAFYDRNNPKFKDKVFTAREWQEISNKLGYDVSLLKDRMLQLRNRYNLEKRRIEQLREENPGAPVESPWPLFDHLHFLSEHIRARRSYKRMLNAAPQHATRLDLPSGGSNTSSGGGVGADDADENSITQLNMHPAAAFPNGFLPVRVKMEHDDDAEPNNSNGSDATAPAPGTNGNIPTIHMQAYQQHQQHLQQQQQQQHQQQHQAQSDNNQQNDTDAEESESQSVPDNGTFLPAQSAAMLSNKQYALAKHQKMQQQQHHHHQQLIQQQQRLQSSAAGATTATTTAPPPPLKIRRIDTMRVGGNTNTWIPVSQTPHKRQQNNSSSSSHSNNLNNSNSILPRTAKIKSAILPPTYATPREQKYAAFGDFVASSLLDLPPVTAMHLIEKFTTEVVKVLIENDGAAESEQNPASVANNCNGVAANG